MIRQSGCFTKGNRRLIQRIANLYTKRLKEQYTGINSKHLIVVNPYGNNEIVKYQLLTIEEYNSQIKDAMKRSQYQRDYELWKRYGYPEFEVRGEVIQKTFEWLYVTEDEIRSRAITNPISIPANKNALGVGRSLFKSVIGAVTYNITEMNKYLLHKSNIHRKNK